MATQAALDAGEELLTFMISRAEGNVVNKSAYVNARATILDDPTGKRSAPKCVRICRDPDAVWSYIKSQDPGLDTYESRRQFLRAEFEPLLSALESLDQSPIDDLVGEKAGDLDAAAVERTWHKALERRMTDPEGAITAARTMLESVCKTILEDRGVDYEDKDDLPRLYRHVSSTLGLAPSDHTEQQFKAILGGCTTIVRELGSLRNRVSDSHGPGRTVYRPAKRHAALAVNLAGAMALFLMQTHEAR
jgi:hypothetical protein